MQYAVLPTREPTPIEELISKRIEELHPDLMATQSGSVEGILDIIHLPDAKINDRCTTGSLKITCHAETGNRILQTLKLHGVSGSNGLGQEELYLDALAVAKALNVSAEFLKLLRGKGGQGSFPSR